MKTGNTITGYTFPNPPDRWSADEKRFALALRGLFDILFQKTRGLQKDFDKTNYNALTNKPAISGQTLIGNKSLSDLGIHNVNETSAGLMTSEMLGTLNDISAEVDYFVTQSILSQLDEIKSALDYVTMMSEIDIPTDTDNKVRRVAYYYRTELWNIQMVWDAVDKEWISEEDYEEITGEEFPPFRPEEEEPDPEEQTEE